MMMSKKEMVEYLKSEYADLEKHMKKTKIKAANKRHFNSLIKDYRETGYMIITFGKRLAELEKENDFVTIYF